MILTRFAGVALSISTAEAPKRKGKTARPPSPKVKASGGEAEQGGGVASRGHGGQGHGLIESEAVEFGVVIGGAVEADDALEIPAVLGAGDQFVEDAGVA